MIVKRGIDEIKGQSSRKRVCGEGRGGDGIAVESFYPLGHSRALMPPFRLRLLVVLLAVSCDREDAEGVGGAETVLP